MAAGKKETSAQKRFSAVLLFGEKPSVISWLVSSQQPCKRFVAPASGSPLLCPTQLSLRDVQQWCFQRCRVRQVPEHYIPPSYGLVCACWMLCLEVVEPGRAGQP